MHIAASSHQALGHLSCKKKKQWTDEFGEHDVALSLAGEEIPSTVVEVKYARSVGNDVASQDQVVQPYCYFLYDVVFSGLSHARRGPSNPVIASVAFIEDAIYSRSRTDSPNPWRALVDTTTTADGSPVGSDSIDIVPSSAGTNAGRGANKRWPDFRASTTIERRHISLVLTGGTSTKLHGIFLRDRFRLRVVFHKRYRLLELPDQSPLHLLAIEAVDIRLVAADGTMVTDQEQLLKWLP